MKQVLLKLPTIVMAILWSTSLAIGIVASEFVILLNSLLAASVLFTIIVCFQFKRSIVYFIKSRLFKSLSYHLVNLFLIFAILGIINFLVVKNDKIQDFTLNKIHTLSSQSIQTINQFGQEPLVFKLFAQRHTWDGYRNLFDLYKEANSNLSVEYYDIDKEITLVELYGIKQAGTLIIPFKGKNYRTLAKNELAVTNLLLKIVNPKKKVLYYSVGHNEMSLTDKNQIGGDYLREKILDTQFQLRPIELQKGIPSDASAVLVLNPQIEFLDSEIKNLKTYLKKGGSLLTTLSPYFNGVLVLKYVRFLKSLGVEHTNGIILDRLATQQGSQASTPVVNTYGRHQITENFVGRTLYPVSSFLSITDKEYKWTSISQSTPFPGSWGEINFDEVKQGRATYNEDIDGKGPLTIIAIGENLKTKSRIFVSSSTNFISNQFQGQSNNFNLFLNGLSWLAKEEALMSLDRPKLKGDIIYISDLHLSFVFYFVILLFPFVYFGVAIYFFRKRLNS